MIENLVMKTLWLMMTSLALTLNCFSVFADPLNNWHWRNPLPSGNPQTGPHILSGIVFANGKFVGVGAGGMASISTDTTNWIESATATANTLRCITYANSQFVAVGDAGTVETSADGSSWVLMNSGTSSSLNSVAYGNGKFVAVGGAVITSADAANWVPSVSGLSSASSVAGGGVGFVAVDGTTNVYFSPDGLTWTSQTLTAPTNGYIFNKYIYSDIVTYASGVFLVGAHRYPMMTSADAIIYSSADGLTWSTNAINNIYTGAGGFIYNFFLVGSTNVIAGGSANNTTFQQFSSNEVNWSLISGVLGVNYWTQQGNAGTYGNGTYVIVAPFTNLGLPPAIYTSTDGLTWTNRDHPPAPPAGSTNNFTGIAFSNGVYVVAASNAVVRSTDVLTYTAVGSSPALASVITTSSGFIGVGSGGNIYVSSDGLSWTQRTSGTFNNLHAIAFGGGLLVAVGDSGTIQTSSTGTIWTSRTSGTSFALYGAAYSNGLFVVVGQLGTVLTSPDGINWSGQYSGQLSNLLSVACGSAGFAAVGPGGTILTSQDGINWTKQNAGTQATLESITFGNVYFLVSGDNGLVMTSPDGVNWTARNVGATGGQNLYGSAFLNNRFDVVGSGGTVIESDPFAPLFDLQIHLGTGQSGLTVFATPGSSFRIQTCTNLSAPGWTDAASFNNAAAMTQWTNSSAGFNQRFYRIISP